MEVRKRDFAEPHSTGVSNSISSEAASAVRLLLGGTVQIGKPIRGLLCVLRRMARQLRPSTAMLHPQQTLTGGRGMVAIGSQSEISVTKGVTIVYQRAINTNRKRIVPSKQKVL